MLKDQVTFRRLAAGTLLIVAPLLQAVAAVLDPGTWGDDRESVSYGDNPALAQTESALYHWSWLLMALAALGLMHLTRRKATVLGHLAGAAAVVGYISASGLLLTDPVEWWLGRHYPDQAQDILKEMMDLPGVIYGFQMPWMFLAILGLPILAAAVWRTGFVGWWVPALVAVGYVFSFPLEYNPLIIVFWTLPVIALGFTGVKILRMSDADWAEYYPGADRAAGVSDAGVGAERLSG
ncbi:hypothetical protein HII36_43320 [Nonomuraea sp. NN258]|uniref:hypothetical protein n=1 Tax=Nonomuraea antri TaxID=2730852 RepID=UPI00156839BB|nr:hypothetical protein [Nonomuraea antri]NRQ38608.1 hypothetical protein [Nonomuraea antri]